MKKNISNKKILISIMFSLTLLTLISFFIKKEILLLIIISFIIAIICFFLFKNKKNLLNEIKSEIKNIHWPNKKEIQQAMIMILLIIVSASIIIWIIDSILTFFISKII